MPEAVTNTIKRRRKQSVEPDAPVTLKERRAHDTASIMDIIKGNKNLLVEWSVLFYVIYWRVVLFVFGA